MMFGNYLCVKSLFDELTQALKKDARLCVGSML